MEILQPPGWPGPKGYSNGILTEGKLIFVAGQIGWDDRHRIIGPDFADQVKQALKNIVSVISQAGARPEDIVRMTWYVSNKKEYLESSKKIGDAYREVIGNHYPAMTLVQIGELLEEGAKVEIEATAVIPKS